ncbi:hypothetical protein B0H11DRAFT_820730 [Mycena galericulata]|nr:hypothetical protein B0H11DRAFT_820730 [Mycena galericulata]
MESANDATLPSTSQMRSEIWMPYGDIILEVESTQFRVNRDVLAKHSTVFRHLFAVPQPANEATLEGCPVVQLSGDSAQDWALLLEVLYDPFEHSVNSSTPKFPLLAAMLRLGRKYEIAQAEEDALARIRYEFPADYAAFNALDADMTRIKYHKGIYCDLLNLAYECGVYSSVPLLAFCCLRTDRLETIFKSVRHADGSPADDRKIMLALALEQMSLFQHENLAWLRDASVIPHDECATPERCTQQQQAMARVVDREHEGQFNLGYTIDEWDDRWTGLLCPVCEEAAEAVYERNRAKGWELLPSFFGLPGWEELKDVE